MKCKKSIKMQLLKRKLQYFNYNMLMLRLIVITTVFEIKSKHNFKIIRSLHKMQDPKT